MREIETKIEDPKIENIRNELSDKSGLDIKYFELDAGYSVGANMDYDDKSTFIKIGFDKKRCGKSALLHEFIHGHLRFLEDWPVPGIISNISDEDRKVIGFIPNYITEDPIIHRRIMKMGLNPIEDAYFSGLNKNIKWFQKGRPALNAFDKHGKKAGHYFRIFNYIQAHIILKELDPVLDYGKREKLKDFINYFKSSLPNLCSEANSILSLYSSFDGESPKECKNILEKMLAITGIDSSKVKSAHYIRQNGYYRLEIL